MGFLPLGGPQASGSPVSLDWAVVAEGVHSSIFHLSEQVCFVSFSACMLHFMAKEENNPYRSWDFFLNFYIIILIMEHNDRI